MTSPPPPQHPTPTPSPHTYPQMLTNYGLVIGFDSIKPSSLQLSWKDNEDIIREGSSLELFTNAYLSLIAFTSNNEEVRV